MKILLDDLPLDASDKRRAKIFLIAYHVYDNIDGLTYEKLLYWATKRFSNTQPRLNEYIAEAVKIDIMSKIGNKYYVTPENLEDWGEAHGFIEIREPVKCLGCGYEYFTSLSKCPKCRSVEREAVSTDGDSTLYTQPAKTRTRNEIIQGEDVNQPIHKNIPKDEKTRQKNGKTGELNAVEVLNQYGEASKGKGTYGEPDVYWISKNHSYGCEVKSVGHGKKIE